MSFCPLTVTSIFDLALSQPLALVCDTQQGVVPTVVVLGVGVVELLVPPVAAVYHCRVVPVAVKALAVVFWQYNTEGVTVGADGARA